jgi:putative hydrolase of the HAD superfamily
MTINIVFDFGAVLFSWRPDLLLAEQFPHRAATPQAAQTLARDIFHHDDWQSFDRGTLALEQVAERTARRTELPVQELWSFMSGIGERLAPMPDSVALLTALRERRDRLGDLRLYFLSNMPAPFARVLERRHDFLRWFDGGVFSADVQLIKPDPAIYALLETRYALEPAQTVFVDDLAANIAAAQARGWRGVHFESAEQVAPHLLPAST